MVELHQEGSVPAACAAGLFIKQLMMILLVEIHWDGQGLTHKLEEDEEDEEEEDDYEAEEK